MHIRIILIIVLFLGLVFNISTDISADEQSFQNSYHAILGEKVRTQTVEFSVQWAEIGRWIEDWEDGPKVQDGLDNRLYGEKQMIAVHFELSNIDPTKKIDLASGFEFNLADEYGNGYRPISKPKDYFQRTQFKSVHFPSLYPEEKYAETVFFEAPIKTSNSLIFSVTADQFNFQEPLAVKIPISKVQKTPELLAQEQEQLEQEKLKTKKPERSPRAGDMIRIVFPRDGISVRPGAVVHINVELQEGAKAPKSIFVVSPIYVLEDTIPAYSYNFMVPKDQAKGELTIVVIGRWTEDGEDYYVSDSITFRVIDPKQRCVENCISNTS